MQFSIKFCRLDFFYTVPVEFCKIIYADKNIYLRYKKFLKKQINCFVYRQVDRQMKIYTTSWIIL